MMNVDVIPAIKARLGMQTLEVEKAQTGASGASANGNPHRRSSPSAAGAPERAKKYIEKMLPGVQGENGSGATFAAACACFRFGLCDEDAVRVINEFNERCRPPWSEAELAHKLADAKRAVTEAGEFHQCAMLRE